MSLEIISHNLDEHKNESLVVINPDEKLYEYSEMVQLQTAISETDESSLILVDDQLDPSVSSSTSTSKSESSTKSEQLKEFRKITCNNEFYEGTVLFNNLHGHGFLSTQKNAQTVFFDGLFYLNKIEGYNQIFYEDGTHFQGLFKQHKRYGPGVLTYPNGTQDVGFWNGFSLLRLASVVGSDTVPKLVTTVSGKTKLLCHKYLVPLCEENVNLAEDIFKTIDSKDAVLNKSDEVLNVNIRNPNSLFFHKKFFDRHFFDGKDCTIKVAVDEKDLDGPLEESEKNTDKDVDCNRIEHLKSKIKEVDESMQPFLTIKENLLEKIRYCTKCCNKDSSESLKAHEPSYVESHASSPNDTTVLDLSSIQPDGSFYDPSIASNDSIPGLSIEEALHQITSKSSLNKIIEYCSCGEQREIEDLQHLEDQLSNVVKQETFYRNIRDNLQKKVDKILEKEVTEVENPPPRFKLVEVSELWAWNSEELLIQIQKHCFRHRNSEDMVNFTVSNLILGNRKDFGDMGEYEEICHKFLIACSKGKKDFVRKCLREKINPNLSDARGNSGIFFAAAKNQIEIISILTDFGAKLDQINDEELTPLSLCLLKYLSQKNKSDCWETAFLPDTEICTIPNLPKWYDVQSFFNLSATSSKHSDSIDQSSQNDYSNSRIVELFRRLSNLQQKTSSFIRHVPNSSYVFDLSYRNSDSPEKQVEEQDNEDVQKELKATHLTIMTLLDYGADPNSAKVPYPPLVLSLFTENPHLVSQVLQANADVNVLATDHNLSCLHILSSFSSSENNIEICRLLLMFKCDPNLKALPSHWEDRKSYFTGNMPQEFYFEDLGKNALHLLCMRKDFDNDNWDYFGLMCKILIKGGVDCNDSYLGHTPLSLAVLAGNIRLVKYLVKINVFDPYESLQYNMGNILTLFTLKRFENILPTDKCKAMLTALFEANVNVLHAVGEAENAIAFADEGDILFNLMQVEKDDKKLGKSKVKPASKLKKVDKHSQSAVIKECLKDLGRHAIIRRVQMLGTEALYHLAEENMLEAHEVCIAIAEFLTPHIAVDNLEALFHSEKIDHHMLNHDNVIKFLHFVDLHKKDVKAKKGVKVRKEPKGKKGKDLPQAAPPEHTIEDLIATANFKKSAVVRLNAQLVWRPGLDDPAMYEVCFHCLLGRNKELKVCPRCQMIPFCSIQCNKLNLKLKTQHTCGVLFYDMTENQLHDITKGESLQQLARTAKDNCLNRLYKKQEALLLQEERKLLEMWRADTYGTKFLKFKPLLCQATKNRKGKELSLNLDGLKKLLERNFRKNPADFDSYCLEALLGKLSSTQKLKENRKSGGSSTVYRLGSRQGSVFSGYPEQEEEPVKPICKCPEQHQHPKIKRREKSCRQKKQDYRPTKRQDAIQMQFEPLPNQFEDLFNEFPVRETSRAVTKKIKKIPQKYQKFMEILGSYFPDVDLSFWLLPYACCSNGQLFYKFCNNDIFRESYSLT